MLPTFSNSSLTFHFHFLNFFSHGVIDMKTDLSIEMPDGRLKKFGYRFVHSFVTCLKYDVRTGKDLELNKFIFCTVHYLLSK